MKAIILLNGEPYSGEIKKDGAVYCCDGAYSWAKNKIVIDENLGDFDSLSETPVPAPEKIYSAEKNYTDGEIATRRALSAGAKQINFYGGFGGRVDHFLGNLQLLHICASNGARGSLIGEKEVVFAADGYIDLSGNKGKTLSIVPFGGNAHIIESSGLYYPLTELPLVYGSTRGISNIAVSDEAHILSKGYVLVIVNREVAH